MLRLGARPLLALRRAAAAAAQEQQWGGAAAGGALRWMSEPTGSAKEAVERTLVVNTLDLSKKLESAGLNRGQAEALTGHITTQVILDRLRLSEKFVHKVDLEKLTIEQEAKVGSFKAELVQKQEGHLSMLQKDLERQQNYLDKMRSETRHEIDKLTSSQRLDLNLEKGRMRDDLQHMRDKAMELELKMDREVNELKATVEKAKNDIIKTVIGVLGTFSAIAFTISRLVTMAS
ncbi:MAG: chloroplast tscA maturation factor [Monoraphidium minutum]|nr:MAG: chloroplast tscA maturation factor [Monoraphidium minutum]